MAEPKSTPQPKLGANDDALPGPYPAFSGCACWDEQSDQACVCDAEEKALRLWAYQKAPSPMTPEQREWCAAEIDSVECHDREDYEGGTDAELAMGVLRAWQDFARDKGLL